jgi:hypothetical protein
MITNDAGCTHKIKSRTDMAKAALNKKTFHQHAGLQLKKEVTKILHLKHSFISC